MIKFDERVLQGKNIEELDERYFRLDGNDEIKLTPFAEDKIAKAMKDYYGSVLKKLSLAAGDLTYLTQSKDIKDVKDEEASQKLKEEYESRFSKEYPLIEEELEKLKKEYQDSHRDEFVETEILDGGTYLDEDGKYKSSGGNLYGLSCTSIKDAAIGYQTASQYLKDNPVDKDSAPIKIIMVAKDKKAWENAIQEMRKEILNRPEFSSLPKDIFKPIVTKQDYSYSINWRKTKEEAEDDSMITNAANTYIENMLNK